MPKPAKKPQPPVIPPPGSGRPIGPDAKRLIAMEVGQREPFDLRRYDAVVQMAYAYAKRLGRKYATRIEDEKVVAVWRVA
jgi:hypothetical protein